MGSCARDRQVINVPGCDANPRVDDEKGIHWAMALTAHRVNGATISQLRAGLDFSLAQPFPHSSIWSRTAVGATSGDRGNSVVNFYFGGFGNNYVDNQPVKRYQAYDTMPGFGLQQIGGQSFAKQTIEWNLPPWVLESAGTQAFHLQCISVSLDRVASSSSGVSKLCSRIGVVADQHAGVRLTEVVCARWGWSIADALPNGHSASSRRPRWVRWPRCPLRPRHVLVGDCCIRKGR